MGWFGVWKKIYLFYGVIFFLLGGVGGYLHMPNRQDGCIRWLQRLTADWRAYLTVVPEGTSPAVTVDAPASGVTVSFFCPEKWVQHSPTTVRQLDELLTKHFTRVEMQAVSNDLDFTAWFAAKEVKYPDRIIVGLVSTPSGAPDGMIHLWWRTLAVPPLNKMITSLKLLPTPLQIMVKVRPGSDFWGEVSWKEPSRDAVANLPLIMAVWAETMSTAGSLRSGRQPL
jgi:hypothetical protein